MSTVSKYGFAGMHSTPALLPISYIFFKFPSKDKWISVFVIQLISLERNNNSLAAVSKSLIFHFFIIPRSNIFDLHTYSGYYMQWFIGMTSSALYFVLLLAFATLYTGLIFYITGMVNDLKEQVQNITGILQQTRRPFAKIDVWKDYVMEFQFHNEILE